MVKYLTHQSHVVYLLLMVPLIYKDGVHPDYLRYHKMTKPAEARLMLSPLALLPLSAPERGLSEFSPYSFVNWRAQHNRYRK